MSDSLDEAKAAFRAAWEAAATIVRSRPAWLSLAQAQEGREGEECENTYKAFLSFISETVWRGTLFGETDKLVTCEVSPDV